MDVYINWILDNIVISRSNRLYQFEQACITLVSLITGYIYMYMACFGTTSLFYQWFEGFFLFDIVLTFFVEIKVGDKIEREINQITLHYFKNEFIMDFLPLLPLELLTLGEFREKHFFLLKVLRIRKGYHLMSIKGIIGEVKKYYQNKSHHLVKTNAKVAEDTLNDHNKVNQIIIIHHQLKILKLLVLVLNFSYFFSLSWLIVCHNTDEFYYH